MTTATFSALADDFVAQGLATRGTMMGHPCLRANGAFFASGGGAGDALVVKLPEARVQEEIAAGRGAPFAPAGKPFKQWLEVTEGSERHARERLLEALAFVAG
ncbi:hypothetical protein [Rubrivirga sp. IMCC43871]|uniref:hypothetical protein n=1 Tax=Rubrivirga sp. IMCC43871 TaxID=3391575 RepID=UPI00398FF138